MIPPVDAPLARPSTVDALVDALRARILDGELAAGARLPERELTERYRGARHTLRAALRALAAEALGRIEPHRGATVARLSAEDVVGLYELRAALELEAAHLALARGGGRLPPEVRAATAELRRACERAEPSWREVAEAHAEVHAALVRAARSPRIARAHAALSGETRLFLMQLRPHWSLARLADDHDALVDALETRGPEALREHLREAAHVVIAAEDADAAARATMGA